MSFVVAKGESEVTMRVIINAAVLALVLWATAPGFAQEISGADLQSLMQEHVVGSFDLLHELLSIPNDAHFPDHVRQNVEWVDAAFRKRGFTTKKLPTGGPPLLLAERRVANASRTVLIYLQIDGQPVDPSKWFQESPYKPVLKERRAGEWQEISWQKLQGDINPDWRVFARSASDAKGPVAMFLTALDVFAQRSIATDL
jgi:acetylornithine deacetylase/succinyl-diaminopimelate desuccinylase-like protein